MRRAVALARRGEGQTAPNPPVGALVIKGRRILSEGYHRRAGAPHAEIEALRRAGAQARGATLVVTLEPCCHFGRTPPCTEAILQAGIARVWVGVRDPNPRVAGKGLRRLKSAGLSVDTGILEAECRRLIAPFACFIRKGRPWVTLKTAASLDGKIATARGESRWITGSRARARVHELRSRVDAILVGAGTVVADDPRLTARPRGRRERFPMRVVVDPHHRVPVRARVFANARTQRVVCFTGRGSRRRQEALRALGVEVVPLREKRGVLDFQDILRCLAQRDVMHLLIEGGSRVNALALQAGVVDHVVWFLAPRLIGGETAPGAVGGAGIPSLEKAWKLKRVSLERVGEDWLIEGDL